MAITKHRDPKASYYDAGEIDTLKIIKAKLTPRQFEGFLLGSSLKYLCRMNFKHPTALERRRDIEKANFYLATMENDMSIGIQTQAPGDE